MMPLPRGAHYRPGSKTRVRLADGREVSKYQADKLGRMQRYGTPSERRVRVIHNIERQLGPNLNSRRMAQAITQGELTREEMRVARYGTAAEIQALARDDAGKWARRDRRGRLRLRRAGRPNPFWYHGAAG